MSRSREGFSYGTAACGVCGKSIKRNGFAMVSHMRFHVRNGTHEEMTTREAKPEFRKKGCDGNWLPVGAYF